MNDELGAPDPNIQLMNIKPKRKLNLKVIIVVLILIVLLVVVIALLLKTRQNKTPSSSITETTTGTGNEINSNRLRVIATGDMIPHDSLNANAKQDNGYDYLQFMKNMQKYFELADVRFCNQAVLGAGEKYGITGYPVFNSPTEFSRDMQKVGCNLINTGSNHTNDKTQDVIDASVAVWDGLPNILAVAGANRSTEEMQKVRTFEVKGVKFAFLSYTTYSNTPGKNSYGLTLYSEEFAKKQLSEAKAKADIIIVSMRWGTEYSDQINATQNSQSQFLADNGADIVLGHGPHILQPVKKLKAKSGKSTYVWYSLGNFLNAQLEATGLINGFAVMDIDTQSKTITDVGYLPTYVHYEWTQAQKAREDLLARKNFSMHLLEDSDELIAKSQLGTSVDEQTKRIRSILNKHTSVDILSEEQYLAN